MKNLALFLILFMMSGYTTINSTNKENTPKVNFEDLVLIPDYDLYNIRIDIIRLTKLSDSITEKENINYSPIGYYLGNGLFVDTNDNISFLIPKLFHIKNNDNFTIKQGFPDFFYNRTIIYKRQDSLFSIENKGLINVVAKNKITKKDSAIFVKYPILSKYTLIKSDSSLSYQSGWNKILIKKYKEAYKYKTLFGNIKSQKKGNEVYVNNRYLFKRHGDTIEIYNKGLGKYKSLSAKIIKSDKLLVVKKYPRDLEITVNEKEITIKEGKSMETNYTVL